MSALVDSSIPAEHNAAGPARLWFPVAAVVAYWMAAKGVEQFAPGTFAHFMTIMWAPMLLAVLLVGWWLGLSKLSWRERLLAPLLIALGGAAIIPLTDKSVKLGLIIVALPWALTAAVAWTILARHAAASRRLLGLAGVLVVAWGFFTLVRIDGLGGNLATEFSWRWTTTAEERFLAERSRAATEFAVKLPTVGPGDWPEFRGPERDSKLTGVKIATDWSTAPPKLLWKHRVGPAWSSFAVVGDYGYTQEQRGEEEATVCYHLPDGAEIWAHLDPGRFWEVVAGAGPRATPTYRDGKLYAFGANGLLTCLDAATGKKLWQRNVQEDTKAATPVWGFSASPLVYDDKVIVIAGGPDGKGTAAYRIADGEPAWYGGAGKHSYSSVQAAQVDGVDLLLSVHDDGLDALNPADGKTIWKHDWQMEGMRVLQPYSFGDGRIILSSGYGMGSRLLNLRRHGDAWQTDEVWTSKKFNPYYNDFVVHDGHAYGFDGNIFCCIDLKTGDRPWKKGRYGYGQVLLLADQGLLLVLGDEGQAVLVEAKPDALHEVGRFQALEGKTWNHPVVTRGKLLVRNAEEAACYELKLLP